MFHNIPLLPDLLQAYSLNCSIVASLPILWFVRLLSRTNRSALSLTRTNRCALCSFQTFQIVVWYCMTLCVCRWECWKVELPVRYHKSMLWKFLKWRGNANWYIICSIVRVHLLYRPFHFQIERKIKRLIFLSLMGATMTEDMMQYQKKKRDLFKIILFPFQNDP